MKRNYKGIFGLMILVVMMQQDLRAQDPHFSQYFMSNMTLNPALTAKNTGDWQATANFRSQWWGGSIAPFYTTTAIVEKRFTSKANSQNYFGGGISFLTDASNNGLLKNNYFTASGAYHIGLDKLGRDHLSVGLQLSYANRMLDASKFEFQSQFGSMGFQRTSSSGDPATAVSNSYMDVNGGAYYNHDDKNWGFGIGAAVYHASGPKTGAYQSSTYTLPQRYTINGSVYFKTGDRNRIDVSGVTDMQGGNTVNTIGVLYKIAISNDELRSLNVGAWARFGDAYYPYLGVEGKSWVLGLSYDIVDPKIKSSFNSVQSMEVSFSLLFGKKKLDGARVVSY